MDLVQALLNREIECARSLLKLIPAAGIAEPDTDPAISRSGVFDYMFARPRALGIHDCASPSEARALAIFQAKREARPDGAEAVTFIELQAALPRRLGWSPIFEATPSPFLSQAPQLGPLARLQHRVHENPV